MASIVASSGASSATRAADFEYERVARFVAHAACKRLALQFPDALLSLSPAVAMELEAFLPDPKPEVYVLGDPAPGGAVDCVAAAHVDADAIVHYGPDCLAPAPAGAPPVLFVVGPRPAADASAVAAAAGAALRALAEDEADAAADVLILAAPEYAARAVAVADLVAADLGVAVVASALPRHARVGPGEDAPPDAGPAFNVAGLVAPLEAEADLRRRRVVLVGAASTRLGGAAALCCAGCVGGALAVVDPLRPDRAFGADGARRTAARALAKRHHALSRARRATRWGICAAAAGRLRDVSEVAASCDAALRAAGRSSYVLAVGPVTPTKLANFAELEAFVVVGADHGLLDALAAESNAPLISPNELAVVLGDADWLPEDAPFYSCDLGDVAVSGERGAADDADDAPTFDLSAGHAGDAFADRRVRLAYDDDDDAETAVVAWKSAAADFLNARDWRGLEVARGETPVRPAVEGRTGVASGYAQEERAEGGG